MFELFGAEMPLAVRFFLAFLIVLGLIGATAWAVRRFGSGRLGGAGMRGRQPRLAVIDHTSVDTRRRLVLVRRDNVEHLLMIGGPSDVVVESNIVRATPAGREVALPRPAGAAETLPRAIPLPEAEGNGSWPLQPEPAGPPIPPAMPRRAPRIEPIAEEPVAVAPPPLETPQRRQRDVLTALADDLSAAPAAPLPPRIRPAPAPARPPELRAEPRVEARPEPRVAAPVAPPVEIDTSAADQNLAEMAQRLEAALRKPKTSAPIADTLEAAPPPPAAPAAEAPAEAEPALPPPPPPPPAPSLKPAPVRPVARAAESKAARPDPKAKEGKLYDTLEQEMASLLGRPPGKA